MIEGIADPYMRLTMPSNATEHQRDLMRSLYRLHGGNQTATCAAYVRAEAEGRAYRKNGSLKLSPEEYAKALLADGLLKGWISDPEPEDKFPSPR